LIAPNAASARSPAAAGGWAVALLAAGSILAGAAIVKAPLPVIAAALGLIFAAVAFANLAAGLAAFTILTFLNRIPGAGSGVTFVKLAGVVLVGAWLFDLARRDRRARLLFRDHPTVAAAAVAFLAWTLLSLLWAPDLGRAGSVEFRLAQDLVLLFITYTALRERRHVYWFVAAFIAGAVLSAAIGLAGNTSPEQFNPATGVTSSRLTGAIGDPNELAAILVPALTFALFGLAAVRSPLLRGLLLACASVTAFALFRTESRGGLVALALVAVATLLFAGRLRLRALPVILTIAGSAVAYFTLVAPPEALARLTEYRTGGGSGRTDLWRVAEHVFEQHPLAGIGIGNFQVVEPVYSVTNINIQRVDFVVEKTLVVHNTYLHVLAELGVVGFLPFAAMIVGAIGVAVRATRMFLRAHDLAMDALARGVVIGTIGMLGSFTFISAQYEKQLPLLLGVLVALSAVARAETRAADEAEAAGIRIGAPRPLLPEVDPSW
jgi:O-antigen ligase